MGNIWEIALLIITSIGLILNGIEQILIFRSGRLKQSFTVLVLCLSYSDCFICLSTMGRMVGNAIAKDEITKDENGKKQTQIFNAVSFSLILTGYLGNSSIIWLMSAERFLAICFPFRHRVIIKRSKTFKMIASLWTFTVIFSFTIGCVQYFQDLEYFLVPKILQPTFIITFVILVIVYSFIIMKMRQHSQRRACSDNASNKISSQRKEIELRKKQQVKVLKLSCLIVASFLLCNTVFVVANFRNPNATKLKDDNLLGIGVCFMVLVAFIDPILYFIKSFRINKRNKSVPQISASQRLAGEKNAKSSEETPQDESIL